MNKSILLTVALGLTGAAAQAARVQASQQISLVKGWNAVYLTVAPDGSADEVFADWPVDYVAAYDQAAFLETRQYSGADTTEGAVTGGYRTWHRGDPGASSLKGVPANTVYVCFATNALPSRQVFGRPSAPRVSWHASSVDESMNLVGLSVSEPTALGDYFDGLDVGNTTYRQFYGSDPAAPRQAVFSPAEVLATGSVLVMDSSRVSDWSGVLNVSPVSGVDFGSDASLAAVQVRNDGAAARTVRLSLASGLAATPQDLPPPVPAGLQVKDVSSALAAATNRWTSFTPSQPFEKGLAPGETLNLQLALDRTRLAGPAGTYYGALLEIADVDGGSHMLVRIPVEATGDGGASAETAWPKGIWLATAELDTVTSVGRSVLTTNTTFSVSNIVDQAGVPRVVTNEHRTIAWKTPVSEAAAGGRMRVRLPMYVDREGRMTLLQRFWYGRDAEGRLHAVAGSEASDVPLGGAKRVSTAFLPTDRVKIPAGGGTFGTTADFPFVVAETSPVNPMLHAFHPQHDGKGFDFETPSPSGDDLRNYEGTVKPESFSITNTVRFAWEPSAGTAWNPDESLKGRLVWEFDGLRHEGTVRASGPFVMKRISAATLEK